jgi:hypothetical protein
MERVEDMLARFDRLLVVLRIGFHVVGASLMGSSRFAIFRASQGNFVAVVAL